MTKNIFIVLLLALSVITTQQLFSRDADVKAMVYQVCNDSRTSPTITEEQCGNIQDLSNTEFLCEANNPLPSNYCWVEVK